MRPFYIVIAGIYIHDDGLFVMHDQDSHEQIPAFCCLQYGKAAYRVGKAYSMERQHTGLGRLGKCLQPRDG